VRVVPVHRSPEPPGARTLGRYLLRGKLAQGRLGPVDEIMPDASEIAPRAVRDYPSMDEQLRAGIRTSVGSFPAKCAITDEVFPRIRAALLIRCTAS
jgi:hypothetical protein